MWNAIDPNLVIDDEGCAWLSFGSFWSGLKLVKMKDDITGVAQPQEWYTIASRPRNYGIADSLAGNAAIEAPFIIRKYKYYYMFASFDYCCWGVNTTYKIVDRSEHVIGPYVDKTGKKMAQEGGSIVLEGNKAWYGVGHNSTYTFNGTDYLVFHGYDASDNGKSKLRIEKLNWDTQGWPVVLIEK